MADKRADQLKEITERLEQGVKDIFTSEMYTKYLLTMSKFHNYSYNNTLLIAMQRPDATLVAGYNAWKNKFNRYVKKGEKGIQIIAPAPVKEREEREKIDKDTGLTVLNESGEPEIEVVERVIPRFRVTTVFDYAQTDGEPLPTLEVNELTARVKGLYPAERGNRTGISCANSFWRDRGQRKRLLQPRGQRNLCSCRYG